MWFPTSFLLSLGAAVTTINGALVRITDFGYNPTNLEMNIAVPEKLAYKPAIILALHGCFGSGETYAAQTTYDTLSEQKDFITIYPSSKRDFSCWEINTAKGLSRNSGGDNQGLVSMINYTISKHSADPSKVFVTGSSSGCMMTNVLLATYPDVFAAATCYSGIAAGCLAGSPGASPISADPRCANGLVRKTQAEWVSIVRAMYPGYDGKYPKLATWHGTADTLVKLPNLSEQLKQWSRIQGADFSSNITNTPEAGYTKIVYDDGSRLIGYEARGVGHTVPVHEEEDLTWFGI